MSAKDNCCFSSVSSLIIVRRCEIADLTVLRVPNTSRPTRDRCRCYERARSCQPIEDQYKDLHLAGPVPSNHTGADPNRIPFVHSTFRWDLSCCIFYTSPIVHIPPPFRLRVQRNSSQVLIANFQVAIHRTRNLSPRLRRPAMAAGWRSRLQEGQLECPRPANR